MTSLNDYDRPNASISEDGALITIRASAIRDCRRSLGYAALNVAPTNSPEETQTLAMESGKALEPVVAGSLQRQGWGVSHFGDDNEAPVVVGKFHPNLVVVGHPDAHGSHPSVTDNHKTLVEIKTRSSAAVKRQIRLGLIMAQPGTAAQAAFYHRYVPEGTTDPDQPAVIATMNVDTREIGLDFLLPHQSDQINEESADWLTPLVSMLDPETPLQDRLPGRDFDPGSYQCSSCPWLTACQGEQTEAEEDGPELDDEAMNSAFRRYASAIASLEGFAELEKERKAALAAIKRCMQQQEVKDVAWEDEGVHLSAAISHTPSYEVNIQKLEAILTPAQYREVILERATSKINIRREH